MNAPAASRAKSDYIDYPKTLAPDDFWGQVRRTIHGRPVGADQIRMIVDAIKGGLDLSASDVVLDVACGNGALSAELFDSCRALHGVDHSEYLVEVAGRNFARPPEFTFAVDDAARYVVSEQEPDRFTKALCYGSFSFFPAEVAEAVLTGLARRFPRLERVFLGNLPDRDRADEFYSPRTDYVCELDDHRAQIGLWRSAAELSGLARRCGWEARIERMPAPYYAHHYRYDAILDRG